MLYVPRITRRLISISQLAMRGAEVTFKKNSVVLTVSGSRFKFGNRLGNRKLYKMNCGSSCFFASVDVVTTGGTFNDDSGPRCSSAVGNPEGKHMNKRTLSFDGY